MPAEDTIQPRAVRFAATNRAHMRELGDVHRDDKQLALHAQALSHEMLQSGLETRLAFVRPALI